MYFLDWDRDFVSPSFERMPEYHTVGDAMGEVFCRNGLDESNFIHLDFLDFAMAILRKEVRVVAPKMPSPRSVVTCVWLVTGRCWPPARHPRRPGL